jgi:hypothetical protein
MGLHHPDTRSRDKAARRAIFLASRAGLGIHVFFCPVRALAVASATAAAR